MSRLCIRPASLSDADAINEIYNGFIRTSAATFDVVEYTQERREAWLAERNNDPRCAVYVACDGQAAGAKIFGFASASRYDGRGGYETSVKTSVFIAPARHGKGAGTGLYRALFGDLEKAGLHRAYATIVAPNPASVALHRRFGFRHLATLNQAGRKFGRFHDVMWFEKRL